MSGQQDPSITPSESASTVSKTKKSRPGKKQRTAMSVTSQASALTGPASQGNASTFARRMTFDPVPQPGKFPIVFPAGAGEPTRDVFMAIDGNSLDKCFSTCPENYINSARYAEFSTHVGSTDFNFRKELTTSSLLGVAQQIVHAHQNMNLPLGDFSSVSSTDVYNPAAVRAIIHQFGEFSVDNLGTRYLYKSYADEVTALVRTASLIQGQSKRIGIAQVLREHWLPVRADDERTAFIVASRVKEYLDGFGFSISMDLLSKSIFTDAKAVSKLLKSVLPNGDYDYFIKLFEPYKGKAEFVAKFVGTDEKPNDNLKHLGLSWESPDPVDLEWSIVPKMKFPSLIEPWLRKRTTISKFFNCGSGLAEKASAVGLSSQLGIVTNTAGVTVVQNLIAEPAPVFSLMACFPPTAVCPSVTLRNVVLTTSLATSARATEFLQLDWIN
jgi:hypothetical protein